MFTYKTRLFAQSALVARVNCSHRALCNKANMSDVRSLKYCSRALKQTDPQNHNGLLSIQTNFPQAALGSGPSYLASNTGIVMVVSRDTTRDQRMSAAAADDKAPPSVKSRD